MRARRGVYDGGMTTPAQLSSSAIDSADPPSAASQADASVPPLLARARSFAAPLISSESFHSGENALAHADGVAKILADIGSSEEIQAAAYLVYASEQLNRPEEIIGKAFGPEFARLAHEAVRLERAQRLSRMGREELSTPERARQQTENVRKMLLAFSRDLRVVLREALVCDAVHVALCHNHPSGNKKPSHADDELTQRLAQACRTMQLKLIDHIVLIDGDYYSYADAGKL